MTIFQEIGEPCRFKIIHEGSCKMLMECLLNEDTRDAKLFEEALCPKHRRQGRPETVDILILNEHEMYWRMPDPGKIANLHGKTLLKFLK